MADEHDRLLDGLTVLDAGQVLAGPFVGSLLGDMGADVIKIEMPALARPGAPPSAPVRALEYRNKRSITLDLRKPEGQEIARRLTASCDAFVENYSPGTMERWGLGFDDLTKVNPRIIMVRISGYGQTGPYRDRTSYDRIGQAVGGMIYVTGEAERPPTHPGFMLGDYISGTFGALAVLTAVYHRDQADCDEPQMVDLSLYESIFRLSGQLAPDFSHRGFVRERTGNFRYWSIPGDQFETKDGKWILILALNRATFERLGHAMEIPELSTDPRFIDHPARTEHVDELIGMIAQWVSGFTTKEVQAILDEHRVPYGPVNSIEDIFVDPHFKAREDLVVVDDPQTGPILVPAVYPRLSHAPGRVYNPAPLPGQHNEEIYKGMLGISSDEFDKLYADEVI